MSRRKFKGNAFNDVDQTKLQNVGQLPDLKLHWWVKEMIEWGEHVRHDILRLEAASGIGPGDPGDPPDDPWE
jgi:hypothetical protein